MKFYKIKNLKDLWRYYGADTKSYLYIEKLMDRIDQSIFINKLSYIDLNITELQLLFKFCSQILEESKIWDEYSIITGESLDKLKEFQDYLYFLLPSQTTLSNLTDIIQWSGLKTVEEIVSVILPICDSNQEYLEYKKLFENIQQSVSDEKLKDTMLPNELVSKILDNLGMVVFYRKNSNILSSLSYEQEGSKLRLCHEWSAYIREHGFENVIDYNYEDETIMRTSDALMKYGYEKIERVYERTRVEL